MIKQTAAVLMIMAVIITFGCKKEETNEVSIDQINIDKSNDYKYIFRDLIKEQEDNEIKHKKNPFKD